MAVIGLVVGFLPKRQVVQMPVLEVTNFVLSQLPSVEVKTATSLPGAGNTSPSVGVAGDPARGFGAIQSGPTSVPPPRPNKPTLSPSAGG